MVGHCLQIFIVVCRTSIFDRQLFKRLCCQRPMRMGSLFCCWHFEYHRILLLTSAFVRATQSKLFCFVFPQQIAPQTQTHAAQNIYSGNAPAAKLSRKKTAALSCRCFVLVCLRLGFPRARLVLLPSPQGRSAGRNPTPALRSCRCPHGSARWCTC